MSTVEQQGVLGDGSTSTRRGAARWRRWRLPIAVGAVVVLVALVLAATATSRGRSLDPDSAEPGGSRALARILAPRGVEVRRATNFEAARQAARQTAQDGAGVTLLVTEPDLLSLDRLRSLRTLADDLVLLEPNGQTLDELAPAIAAAGTAPAQVVDAACAVDVAAAGRALGGGHLYRASGEASVCYRADADAGSWAVATGGDQTVYVLGQSEILTNDRLAEDGDAALAMRTLGRNPVLVWYLPDPLADSAGEDAPSLQEVLAERAPWLGWLELELVFVLLVALFWRARRLGRLVTEPLPVVVRAAETQEGRARLYRRARARGRAAATLRTAALRRIARQLAIGPDAAPTEVAELAASATGWPQASVTGLLLGEAPADDAALVRLASELDALEAAVGRGADTPGWQ